MTYYDLNKSSRLAYQNQYNLINIELISKKLGRIKCECGEYYNPKQKERHERKKSHCKLFNYNIYTSKD